MPTTPPHRNRRERRAAARRHRAASQQPSPATNAATPAPAPPPATDGATGAHSRDPGGDSGGPVSDPDTTTLIPADLVSSGTPGTAGSDPGAGDAPGDAPGDEVDGDEAAEAERREAARFHQQLLDNRAKGELRWLNSVPDDFQDVRRCGMRDHPPVIDWVQQRVRDAYATPHLTLRGAPSLMLVGGTGAGKTLTSWWLIYHLHRAGVLTDWEVITESNLQTAMRPGSGYPNPEALMRTLWRTELLVLDDVGSYPASPYSRDVLYRLVNERCERWRPVIFTTNLLPGTPAHDRDPRYLANHFDDRLISRVARMLRRGGTVNLGVRDLRMEGP